MILNRRNGSEFSEVEREWEGLTAVLIAGGPSLTLEQVAQVRAAREASEVRVIVINDAYLWAPFADVCYFADSQWHEWQTKGMPKPLLGLTADQVRARFAAFAGQKCSIERSGANITDASVHKLRNKTFPYHSVGLSLDPGALVTGRNSGFQAVNLAVLSGVKKIVLLGYDGRPGADGRTHWFGEHPRPAPLAVFEEMRKAFSAAEAAIEATGVRVVNCSPGSAIDSFPKMDLGQAL